MTGDSDSMPTLEDDLLDRLRQEGLLGPFAAVDQAGRTHPGLVRDRNEDALATTDRLFVVADGMGGQPAGDIASRVAVSVLAGGEEPTDESTVRRKMEQANVEVARKADELGLERIGTTLVAAVCLPTHAVITSVGDSRCYRFRDGVLEQLTVDHNVRNELLNSGVPVERAVEAGIRLDLLTSYLGMSDGEVPFVYSATYGLQAGDRFLLCSDGVHGCLQEGTLIKALRGSTCEEAVDAILQSVLAAGATDNATAVVFEVGDREH